MDIAVDMKINWSCVPLLNRTANRRLNRPAAAPIDSERHTKMDQQGYDNGACMLSWCQSLKIIQVTSCVQGMSLKYTSTQK